MWAEGGPSGVRYLLEVQSKASVATYSLLRLIRSGRQSGSVSDFHSSSKDTVSVENNKHQKKRTQSTPTLRLTWKQIKK